MPEVQKKWDWGAIFSWVFIIGLIWWGITAASKPTITTENVDVSSLIPHDSKTEWSEDYDLGESQVTQEGTDGELIKRYTVTYENDEEISRELIDEWVEIEPVAEIKTYGTYEEPEAYDYSSGYSNYSGYGSYNDVGCFKNQYVNGYFRSNGTYVNGYWRNSPSDNCY